MKLLSLKKKRHCLSFINTWKWKMMVLAFLHSWLYSPVIQMVILSFKMGLYHSGKWKLLSASKWQLLWDKEENKLSHALWNIKQTSMSHAAQSQQASWSIKFKSADFFTIIRMLSIDMRLLVLNHPSCNFLTLISSVVLLYLIINKWHLVIMRDWHAQFCVSQILYFYQLSSRKKLGSWKGF